MQRPIRKLVGAVLLIGFVIFYALLAMTVAVAKLPGTSHFVQAVFFVVAGLVWVLPAGLIVTWMKRP